MKLSRLSTNDYYQVTVDTMVAIPKILTKKHILSNIGDVDASHARTLSKKRRPDIRINTVFENPGCLMKCHIEDFDQPLLISPRPLNTYQCERKRGGKWNAKFIGKKWAIFQNSKSNFHFSSETLSYSIVFTAN